MKNLCFGGTFSGCQSPTRTELDMDLVAVHEALEEAHESLHELEGTIDQIPRTELP